jgi:hypothetical protein
VKKRGLTVEEEDITQRLIEPIDPTTGNRTPAVQMLPDIGFEYNAGASYWQGMGELLTERIASWPEPVAKAALAEMATPLAEKLEIDVDNMTVKEWPDK